MSKKIQRLLIIPARGNSKRIKNKNIKLFCGKPIINYSLLSATKSKLFNKIHVSTDSKKIFNTVINCGYKIDFMRPILKKTSPLDLWTIIKIFLGFFKIFIQK